MMEKTVFFILLITTLVAGKDFIRVCYYTNWAQYRPPPMQFFPEDVDPSLCTHIMYAFAKIGTDYTLQPYEWNDLDMYPRIMKLKKHNPSLRIHLAVGGWNHEGTAKSKFSAMVNNDGNRKKFIESSIKTLRKFEFDGLDLDWEYPAGRNNSPPSDKQKYTQLCKDLFEAFEKDGANRMQGRLSLSAAVAGGIDKIENGYEIRKLAKYIDLLNIMAYDFHGNFDEVTGHHTAMDYDGGKGEFRKEYTVRYATDAWLRGGFPANKIALGLATYGRPFRLDDADNNRLNAPKSKWTPPRTGKYTRTTGFLSYYEICNKYIVVSDNKAGAPYGFSGTDWCGFDTKESLIDKVKTLVVAKDLAGIMVWSLALDDFNGSQCGQGKNPLINAVKDYLENVTKSQKRPSTKPKKPSYRRTKKRVSRKTYRKRRNRLRRNRRTYNRAYNRNRRTYRRRKLERRKCRAIGSWSGRKGLGLDQWCSKSCNMGNCPSLLCICELLV